MAPTAQGEVKEGTHHKGKTVGGVCNFLGSVPSQQNSEVTDGPVLQPRVTAQFYLENKGKYIFQA